LAIVVKLVHGHHIYWKLMPKWYFIKCMVQMFGGGRREGSKRNQNFQSTMRHISSTFKVYIFFLIAFFSQYLNYLVIIIWINFKYINNKNNPIVVNLLNINLKRFWNKIVFVPSWLWPCTTHPIYLLDKRKKMNPIFKKEKNTNTLHNIGH
jgi:hypothetical protein